MGDPWVRVSGSLWAAWGAIRPGMAFRTGERVRIEAGSSRAVHLGLMAAAFLLLFLPPLNVGALARAWDLAEPGTPALGLVLTAGGLLLAIWARVCLGRFWSSRIAVTGGHRLVRSGAYRWTRHPIYAGILLAMAGAP